MNTPLNTPNGTIVMAVYIDGGIWMWTFIQEQILGMKWLDVLIGNLLNYISLKIISD